MVKNIKIVVMGSEDVGKTTLMEKFIGNIGKVEHKGITTAIDYGNITVNDKKIHFFGTPGQNRFKFMRDLTLNGVDFVIVIVDGTIGLRDTDKDIINHLTKNNIPYCVFINKIDILTDSEINKIEGEINSISNNHKKIIKGSALSSEGFDELMDILKSL